MLVDSHCHLDFPDFADELDTVVARANDAGVTRMVTISTKMSTFERVLGVAERFPSVYCSVGVHPHEAGSEWVDCEKLVELARHPKVVGIGETGLDYFYEHSPRQDQARSFLAHIEAARQTQLPLIVHTRDADDETIDLLKSEAKKAPFPALIHCFSSGAAVAEMAVELGFYVSLSGILTFKKADELRATVKNVPLENLLVETDSPFLAPIPHRGKRCEPAFVAHTAACLAGVKGISVAEIAKITTDNFHRCFAKVPRA